MTNYLPYIFGLPSLLGGLYLFLFSFRIYKPKYKTDKHKERYHHWLEKFGALMKICSVFLILNGSYDLIKRDTERYKIDSSNNTRQWTAEDKRILIKNCMHGARTTATNYPQITRDYCECSMTKIMNSMSYEEYVKSLKKPQEEQMKIIVPIIQNCINELKKRIDSVDKKKSGR
jgi:hypothetical protein